MKTAISSAAMALAFVAGPAEGQSTQSHTLCHRPQLLASYTNHYYAVRRMHGSRAPGRNIRKRGLTNGRKSTCSQLRRSRNTLARMHFPGAQMLTPTLPYLLPAHTRTLRALGGLAACIRRHESGGNYATNTGNGYGGAYQFDAATFAAAGGRGNPASASAAEQDAAFARWWPGHHSAWPNTSRMCGF